VVGNYQFSFAVKSCQACGESDGGTWGFNSPVTAMPLTPARSRKILGLHRGVDVVSVISSEGWMVCVLGNFPHTRFLLHTCLQQTPPAEATL
jgi:hypothetical protein